MNMDQTEMQTLSMSEMARRMMERKQGEDERQSLVKRMYEAADSARLLGEPEKEVRILMQIAKFRGYLNGN